MTHYQQNIDACRQGAIGDGGVTEATLAPLLARAETSLNHLRGAAATLPHLALADRRDDLDLLAEYAAALRRRCEDVLVLGTGGSNLGAVTVCALATDAAAPRLHFMANIDPASFAALFRRLDPARTGVIAISKSGGTAETLSQVLSVLAWRRAASVAAATAGGPPMVAISEPGARPLRDIAAYHGFPCLDHAPDLGGRFSVLATAMLPALVAGVDAAAVRAGAAAARDHALSQPAANSPPAIGAAINAALAAEGFDQAVLMPYLDGLESFGKWYRQLWAESLGKDGQGTTPIDALGTVDQHSQLQLYLDGPRNKFFTIITGNHASGESGHDAALLPDHLHTGLAYLTGRTMGDLMRASQRGTIDSLTAHGRPVRVIAADAASPQTLGALFMHFMLETLITADLWGVDAFGQPAVEDGKMRARAYLGVTE